MPIYEYKCENCNEEFEALVFRSNETPPCPQLQGGGYQTIDVRMRFQNRRGRRRHRKHQRIFKRVVQLCGMHQHQLQQLPLIRGNPVFKIGFGYDVHALVEGRKLILGGVEIPHLTGLKGHSDADVLIHAIMDAHCGRPGVGGYRPAFPGHRPGL